VVGLFLKLGFSGFGGPLVHIALMETEAVERRRWLSRQEFLDGLALCQVLPGPASTQLGVYLCYLRGGLAGALLGGSAFVLPGLLIMLAFSVLYGYTGLVPRIQGIFAGIGPAVIAVIGLSAWKLARGAVGSWLLGGLAILGFALTAFLRWDTALVLLLCGGLWVAVKRSSERFRLMVSFLPAIALAAPEVYARLSWLFFKMGFLVYGGGYVIIPVVRREAVERYGWFSDRVFLDGLALGQLVPGPIVNLSAFVGYQAAGVLGALVSAAAIFLPAFTVILAAIPAMNRLKDSPTMRAFLQGVNAAVVGAIVAATLPLARTAIVGPLSGAIALAALVLLWRFKVDTLWLVLGAGALGFLVA
jgi:chromate transporter